MELNSLVFPSPSLSWNYKEYLGELLFIPAKKSTVDTTIFYTKLREKAQKGIFSGDFSNPTEAALAKHRKAVCEHYSYSLSGADFSEDMRERVCTRPLAPPGKPLYRASKEISQSFTAQSPSRRVVGPPPRPKILSLDNFDEVPSQGQPFPEAERLPTDTDLTTEDPISVNQVYTSKEKRVAPAQRTNPKEFDLFVDNLVERHIPCLLIAPRQPSCKLMIFYHANAEDIGQAFTFCQDINEKMECYFLLVEYPGYGLYPGVCSEEGIIADVDPVFNFVTKVLNFRRKDIMVMGRSIGGGAATHLASTYETGGLILISTFASIKQVVKHNFGTLSSSMVKERFDNEKKIGEVKCPCLFIHGKDDTLIPCEQSKLLYSRPY